MPRTKRTQPAQTISSPLSATAIASDSGSAVGAPDRLPEPSDPVEVDALADPAQSNAFGRLRGSRDRRGERDLYRLTLLRRRSRQLPDARRGLTAGRARGASTRTARRGLHRERHSARSAHRGRCLRPRRDPGSPRIRPRPHRRRKSVVQSAHLLALDPQVRKPLTNLRIESRQIDHAPSVLMRYGPVRAHPRTLALGEGVRPSETGR